MSMIATAGLVVAVISLFISGLTAWLTLMRRGTVLMTQPTSIYFGPNGDVSDGPRGEKVYLRTLLYSTSRRGRIISSMYLKLHRKGERQNFSVWVHGDAHSKNLFRGSGVFVPDTGVSADHHFLLPASCPRYEFSPGKYKLELFVTLAGDNRPKRLFSTELQVSVEDSEELKGQWRGLYFDWEPDNQGYQSHIRTDPQFKKALAEGLSKALGGWTSG